MPEQQGRSHHPRRVLVALCTATAATVGGFAFAPAGYAEPSIEEVSDQVEDLYHQAEQASERYNAARDDLAAAQRRIDRAEATVAKNEAAVADAMAGVANFASASYQVGGIDPTLQTLLADDADTYLTGASVIGVYADQEAARLEAVEQQRRELEQAELLAQDELVRVQAIEAELEKEKETVEQKLADAEKILDGLEADERQALEDERAREEAAAAASRGDTTTSSDTVTSDVPASGKGQIVVDFAMAQVGEPYLWAAEGPSAWDCSGLTMMAWREAGVSIPRSSSSQIDAGVRVSKSQLQPGDLVFYYSPISHVGIYIGNGKIVHATKPGDVVSVDSVDLMPFAGASRPG